VPPLRQVLRVLCQGAREGREGDEAEASNIPAASKLATEASRFRKTNHQNTKATKKGPRMTTFTDGPAAGVTLSLRRAPMLLRVVESQRGPKARARGTPTQNGGTPTSRFDALDQPDDEPKPSERIHVYRLVAPPSRSHVLARGKHKSEIGGWWESGEYQLAAEQPTDAECRTTAAWEAWATTHHHLVADLIAINDGALKAWKAKA
jgi:hypothetical protein